MVLSSSRTPADSRTTEPPRFTPHHQQQVKLKLKRRKYRECSQVPTPSSSSPESNNAWDCVIVRDMELASPDRVRYSPAKRESVCSSTGARESVCSSTGQMEIIEKTNSEGKQLPEMIWICQNLRNNLQSPNGYLRGVTLRFLCRLNNAEIIEPLIPSVLENLEY